MIRDRVLFALAALLLVAAVGLPFVSHAPNRLLTGSGIGLFASLHGATWLLLLPVLSILCAPLLPPRPALHAATAAASMLLLCAVIWAAGAEASRLASGAPSAARISAGPGAWLMALAAWLIFLDAVRRLGPPPALAALLALVPLLPPALMIALGAGSELSVLREYAARRAVFADACARHIEIVALVLAITLVLGLPLGIMAHRSARWRAMVFPVLNVVQTVPSIALFGLLLPLLTGVADAVPALSRLGLSGVGLPPAIIALTLYSLLPVARNTAAGLNSVPAPVIDAARGIGMTPRRILWSVEMPLALPVLLSGLRIATIQLIGLAIIASLIGAGGLGDIVFQGLFANALGLVLLGVVPVVLIAIGADAAIRALTELTARRIA